MRFIHKKKQNNDIDVRFFVIDRRNNNDIDLHHFFASVEKNGAETKT